MTERGKLILIDGTDSSGKETQTGYLVERLTNGGISAVSMSFPRYDTPTGRIVGECYLGRKGKRSWFQDPTKLDPRIASLYYAADRRSALPEIERIISSGTHIVFDRFVEASKGHQAGKETDPKKREGIINFIDVLEHDLLGLPRADLVLFLYMPHEIGMELKRRKGEIPDGHEENLEHLRKAEETYLELARQNNWRQINCAPDRTIRSLRNPEDIAEEVYQHVKEFLQIP